MCETLQPSELKSDVEITPLFLSQCSSHYDIGYKECSQRNAATLNRTSSERETCQSQRDASNRHKESRAATN